ncbi:hypothetical protein ACT3RU_06980 [Halomonas sp. TP35]
MKEIVKFNLSIGALLTVIVYVTGFMWQYAYLGVITNNINWIRVVTSDYIHLGIMAILFVIKPWALILLITIMFAALSGLTDRLLMRIWHELTFKGKRRLQPCFYYFNLFFGWRSAGKIFVTYLILFIFSLNLFLKVTDVAVQHMSYRLISDGFDEICNKDKLCYQGKVLYVGDKQIYFYSFDDKQNVTDGSLMLENISDWSVTMAWNEQGRDVINQYIANEGSILDYLDK